MFLIYVIIHYNNIDYMGVLHARLYIVLPITLEKREFDWIV